MTSLTPSATSPVAADLASFADRWIVVSGASSGIGRAISVELAAQGARVVLIGRDRDRLAETARLAGPPERSHLLPLDLAHLGDIHAAIKQLGAQLGPLHGLCHSAGVLQMLPLAASKPERVRTLMDINFGAGLELARAVTERSVLDPQGGSLLWIASVSAHIGAPAQVAYSASKGAILAAVRTLAVELAPRRVRVNALSPGMVRTEMNQALGARLSDDQLSHIEAQHPLGIGQPQDVARAAAFLLHPANRWITGADLVIDGGFSVQ